VRGSITRRGKRSWRIRFDLDRVGGKRKVHYSTFRGTRTQAEEEQARLLHEANTGARVDPIKITVAEWLRQWLGGRAPDLAPNSVQRYQDNIERQIIPALGPIVLQKLKPLHVRNWMTQLRASGGSRGQSLSAQSVKHAYSCLSAALQSAVDLEMLLRNPASPVSPPTAEAEEVRILGPEEIPSALEALRGDRIFHIVRLALATGMRRGELLALRWIDINLDRGEVHVTRSLEETKAGGLRFKGTKNRRSRTIPIGVKTVAMLREHLVEQLQLRMKLGAGKAKPDALVFANHEDQPIGPNYLSILWKRATKGIVNVKFHALRHTYASALIADRVDVVTVSTRLGHHSPSFTLRVYGHLFDRKDTRDVDAIEKLL
jgi:integrase